MTGQIAGKTALVTALLVLALVSAASAPTASYRLGDWTCGAGGGGSSSSSSDHYTVQGTLGQLAVWSSSGDTYTVSSGIWRGLGRSCVYLPLVLRAYTTFHEVDEAPDECSLALPVEIGHQYREDFDHIYDKDWYTFTATVGVTHTIQVTNLESDADTVVYLYQAGCGDPAPIWNDDCVQGDPASGSCITWQAPADGDYPVMVRNYYWHIYYGPGFDTGYTLSVREGAW